MQTDYGLDTPKKLDILTALWTKCIWTLVRYFLIIVIIASLLYNLFIWMTKRSILKIIVLTFWWFMWNSNMMYAKPFFSTLTIIWNTDLKHGIYLLLGTSSSAPFLMMEVLFSDKFVSNCSLFLKSQNNKTTTIPAMNFLSNCPIEHCEIIIVCWRFIFMDFMHHEFLSPRTWHR